jgi:hypothetical protein
MEMKIETINEACYYVAVNDKKEIIQGHELQYHEGGQRVIAYNQSNPIFILKGETEEAVNELLNNFEAYKWLYEGRNIRCIISDSSLKNLSTNQFTAGFIPYVHSVGIPFVQTIRGIEIYLEEILPMPNVDDVVGTLEQLGCQFEIK